MGENSSSFKASLLSCSFIVYLIYYDNVQEMHVLSVFALQFLSAD